MSRVSVDQYRGCMFGLAIGDAIGAPMEFLSLEEIKARYGTEGLMAHHVGTLNYTDDTQMSLGTAIGCLRAEVRMTEKGICHAPSVVYYRYLDWLKTQDDPFERRAPGNTCLSALHSSKMGTIEEPINNSKGCGGVMRTAPAGLAFRPGQAFQLGAEFAAITHGHPSGYLTAGFLAELISHLIQGTTITEAIQLSVQQLVSHKGHEETLHALELAQRLAVGSDAPEIAIPMLGEGWVGEEALSIAIYCALKYPADWTMAVLAAVNHSGDSDSTGSICGAILGAYLGLRAIPPPWVHNIEGAVEIMKIADDMFLAFQRGEELLWGDYPGH